MRIRPEQRNLLFITVCMAVGVGTPLAATGGPMRTWRFSGRGSRCFDQAGFTVMELFVVIGLLGVLMAISTPFLLSYVRTSAVRAGAEELATVLNRARQLAIKDNKSMCVTSDAGRVKYFLGCTATVWTGLGTDSLGFIQLTNGISVTGGPVTFTYIGTASTSGTYTVTGPQGATLRVVVAPSGRIAITP